MTCKLCMKTVQNTCHAHNSYNKTTATKHSAMAVSSKGMVIFAHDLALLGMNEKKKKQDISNLETRTYKPFCCKLKDTLVLDCEENEIFGFDFDFSFFFFSSFHASLNIFFDV